MLEKYTWKEEEMDHSLLSFLKEPFAKIKTLPKALRTQALTALTSYFGLEGLVQYA